MKILILLILFLIPYPLPAQQYVMTFSEAEKQGLSIEETDSRYKDALHTEPEKAVFAEKQQEFIQAYREFHTSLAAYLNDNGFFWSEPTRIFSRIYFSSAGEVEYYFLNEQQAGLDENQLGQLTGLIHSFISQHSIEMKADVGFASCSPVVYNNVRTKD